ncbi:MAG: helix-turn-helix domain-containing protein [Lawsonibacter sp.]|nr:helix-turn-helix domain-containing protein [Lawsonibacter sp.]
MSKQGQPSNFLGVTLRDLRRQHGLTLQEMSEKTGLSTGFLSKIERGLSQPSISNLHKICYVLRITINDLAAPKPIPQGPAPEETAPEEAVPLLTTKAQRSLIYNLNDVVKLESILSSNPRYKLDAMTLTGSQTEYVSYKHRYDELGIVTQGQMAIHFGSGQEYVMEEGDVLLIPAGTEHTVHKLSEEVCVSFWFKLMEDAPHQEL